MTTNDRSALAPYRLPRHTRPSRYTVELTPDLDAATFTGQVRIELDTAETATELVLNAIELEILSCTLDGSGVEFELDEESERLFVTPADGVTTGEHLLEISFNGVLNDQLRGFYRSTFTADDGVEHVIATTQMESTDCRRAFPCWDEPEFKAVFGITLIVDEALLAVSNGAEISAEPLAGGKIRRTYADTMVMSSYLVAFVVGPLTATDPIDVNGVPMRVVHVPGKERLTEFALDIGAFSVEYFEEYYGIEYPGDKIDLVALPDFAAGAMENLGCITFREVALLVDADNSTQAERQGVADTVAHEIAHMWFGDLVTMEWWNGIWLNEAFATFMEVSAADAFRPEWHRWTAFGLERTHAFETDSLSSTRSVEFEVHSPSEAEGMFDVLTYIKGGALLRMLEQYLGVDTFRAGVRQYLNTHAYGNTDTADLWDAIEAASGEPVRRIMDSWIWQPGYPLVTARLDGDELVLGQQRFTFGADAGDDGTRWAIPIKVRAGGHTEQVLLDGDSIRVSVGDASGPIVVNADGHGFFRVDYGDLLDRFTPDVLAGLDTLERYTIADDAWNAVIAGRLAAPAYLDLIERFADETTFGVWKNLAIGIRQLRRLLDDEPEVAKYEQRIHRLAAPALERLGEPADGEDDLTASLRGLLLSLVAIHGGDNGAVERARDYYERWAKDATSVDAELAAAATDIVAATGDEQDYELFLGRYRDATDPQVQERHLFALADFNEPQLMQRTCELCLSEIRSQDGPFVLNRCIGNRKLGDQAWQFLRDHWEEADARFPRTNTVRMVRTVSRLDRPDQVAEAAAFFAAHPIEQATKTLEQILELQRVNAATRARERQPLLDALR